MTSGPITLWTFPTNRFCKKKFFFKNRFLKKGGDEIFIKFSVKGKASWSKKRLKVALEINRSQTFDWQLLNQCWKSHARAKRRYLHRNWTSSILGKSFYIFVKINSWESLFETIKLKLINFYSTKWFIEEELCKINDAGEFGCFYTEICAK